MKNLARPRSFAALIVIISLMAMPMVALAKKGEKYYNQGMVYEKAQQWEKAAEQYALALAANPADTEYQLRYRRAVFNASQVLMQQGRALSEKGDFVGAYNAFRQSYAYDPVNELAISEMERMLRLQKDKEAGITTSTGVGGNLRASQTTLRDSGLMNSTTPAAIPGRDIAAPPVPQQRVEQLRVVTYTGDLKAFIRTYAELLGLNVVFDSQSFRQPRNIDISLKDVTAAQALDYVFLQEGLFFQKLGRRTILVADQQRRGTYQQLVIRTFYLSNLKPADAQKYISTAIPAQAGRPTTIAIADPDTNSITIRDTAENVRLIGDILASLDKDRAEVVMDVNIYEVSRDDLLKIGNQIGSNTTLVNLGSMQGGIATRRNFSLALPTALGVGIALPPSAIAALQGRDRTKLLFTTQIHAFNNEESTARIGQRVPVQTAQTFPFGTTSTTGTQTPGGVNTGVGFAGGFPVFNYEQTGLTLKFLPTVYPNLDVQVKMSIESKDVINPGNPTPTFTERSIAGTARIQNNRTMMLASIAQGSQSQSRVGLPLLGLIPVLGRLFTAPEDRNRQVDIVIAVTPRVLRAPAVTPDDELMRPSGTLQTPTSGSVQAVLEEAEREDQLAAARSARNKAVAQNTQPQPQQAQTAQAQPQKPILDEEPPAYVPAPRALMGDGVAANTPATGTDAATNISKALPANVRPLPVNVPKADLIVPGDAARNATTTTNTVPSSLYAPVNIPAQAKPLSDTATTRDVSAAIGDAPPLRRLDNVTPSRSSFVGPQFETQDRRDEAQAPRPVPLKNSSGESSQSKAQVATEATLVTKSAAGLMLLPRLQEMRVGERRRIALLLKTDAPLGLAALTFKFDPQQLRIAGVSTGNLLTAGADGSQPIMTQSVDAKGLLIVSVAPPSGGQPVTGAGILVFIDIEALATGESNFSFDKNNVHLVAADGRSVLLDLSEVKVVVKQ